MRRGALGLLATTSVVLSGCALSLQSLPKLNDISSPTYSVRAVFANVLNLPAEAQVREGAEVVGQVGAISTANFQADLTLNIKKTVKLPVGTTAQIRFDNPLGDEYVMLQPPASLPSGTGSHNLLAAGSLIPESDTNTAPSVEDTFGALSLVLNGGGINQLQTIIHELNNTFAGNQPQIRSFLETINRGVTTITGGRESIDAALQSIQNLVTKLNQGRTVIANGISTLTPAIGVLAGEDKQISSLLGQLSRLGQIGTEVAQQSGQASVQDVKDLLPVVQQLASVSAQLNPDLADLSRFEAETPKVAPGDYLQVNAIVNVMLPAGGSQPSVGSGASVGAASVGAASVGAASVGAASVGSAGAQSTGSSRAVRALLGAGLI